MSMMRYPTKALVLVLALMLVIAAHAGAHRSKPEARKFAKWVTSEVLPSIRKTGGYGMDVDRINLAFAMASQASAMVQRKVFEAVMAQEPEWWMHRRYLVDLSYNPMTQKLDQPRAMAIEPNTMISTISKLPDRIAKGDFTPASDLDLIRLSSACSKVLEQRAATRAACVI